VAADKSLVSPLGASPGASTAAWIMLRVIERCSGGELNAAGWRTTVKDIFPSYGNPLFDDAELCKRVHHNGDCDVHSTLKPAELVVAVHRSFEVSIGIAVGLAVSALWPERRSDALGSRGNE
jgi:hypothetical protein